MMRETDEDKRLDALKRKSAAAVQAKLAEIDMKRSFGGNTVTRVTPNNDDDENVTPVTRACDSCGEPFSPKRFGNKYCSDRCRQRACRLRKLQEV